MARSTRKPASAPCSGSNAADKARWHRAARRAVRLALARVDGDDAEGTVEAADVAALATHGDPWGWATDGLPSLRFAESWRVNRPEVYAALCRK